MRGAWAAGGWGVSPPCGSANPSASESAATAGEASASRGDQRAACAALRSFGCSIGNATFARGPQPAMSLRSTYCRMPPWR
jgi:hypothetical protein